MTAASRRAEDLATAIELAEKFEAKISIVSVVPLHPGRIGLDPWDDQVVHKAELADAKRTLEEHGITPELFEPIGAPAPTIERIAREGGYDVIVIGSRGLGALERLLQGSVSEHVATHAEATVVVAH